MAGYEKNKQRLEALQLLGKDLARRAARKCEICETAGVRLDPWEVPLVENDPTLERTLLLCGNCSKTAEGGQFDDVPSWRCLETVVWSDLPALQVTSIRLLRRLAEQRVDWAISALESVYPSAETEAWLSD